MAAKYTLIFYEAVDGSKPVEEFLQVLDAPMRAKLFRAMGLLEENGPSLGFPHTRPLQDGIFELRAKVGNNITRALFFFRTGKNIIVTNGFVKKSEKTPRGEIEIAQRRRDDYLRREGRQ